MKKIYFLFLYLISLIIRHFFKVEKNLLLFSARGGMGFEDNPKYLFLYAINNTSYRCVWITKNKKLLTQMKEKNYEVYYYLSLNALILTLKANSIYISHSITDVMPVFFNKQTKVINLWHGIPIKKIALLDKHQSLKSKFLYRLNKKVIKYFISNHKSYNHIYQQAFDLKREQVIACGLPRIEYLRNPKLFASDFVNILDDSYNNYLYAPTFRDYEYYNPLFKSPILKELDIQFEQKNIRLYIKLHPHDSNKVQYSEYKNIYFIENDIYEVLPFFQNFISDYSSLIYDFVSAYPDRNLLLFVPDIDLYEKERGFFMNFRDVFQDYFVNNYVDIFHSIGNPRCMLGELNLSKNSCANILKTAL